MNINFEIEKKVINKLNVDNDELIKPWGIETADSYGFFSLEDGVGYKNTIEYEKYNIEKNLYEYEIVNNMPEGKWKLKGREFIEEDTIRRRAELECLEDTLLMDFVVRYRFKKQHFEYAIINNKRIYYKYSNKYNQYNVNEVKLIGKKYNISIKIKESIVPKGMVPMMYVRDSNTSDEWIVHVRMFPIEYKKIVIKLCNGWYKTQPINQKLADILLKSKKIKKYLLYKNEREPYKNYFMKKINPNAFKMVEVKKGEKIVWDVDCIIERS